MRLPPQTAFRLLPLAAVVGLSLACAGFWLARHLLQPDPVDTRRAAERVQAEWREGDAVAVRPWWAQRLREQLGERPWVNVRDLEAEDLSRFGRLWVLEQPGHHDRLGGPFRDGTYRLEAEAGFGPLRLARYGLPPPAKVLYDFRAELAQAKVSMRTKGADRPCDLWLDDRWVCSPADWNFVGRMIVELGDDPREVIWTHPSEEGPISIGFAEVPHGRTLLVHTGLTPPAARAADGGPVTLAVEVDGRVLQRVVQDNRSGFFPTALTLEALPDRPHQVTFRVSAPRAGMRHFCWTAEVRR
jgi:hypothetical protein